MAGAGDLRDRITFQQRGLDANGDRLGPWEAGFSVAAQLIWLKGTESVMDARLQGRQPVVLRVREEARTRAVTSAWRAVNARNPDQVFDIASAAPDKARGFFAILAQWAPANE